MQKEFNSCLLLMLSAEALLSTKASRGFDKQWLSQECVLLQVEEQRSSQDANAQLAQAWIQPSQELVLAELGVEAKVCLFQAQGMAVH